jgi:CBS domain containing-hemolysin-like protein
MALLSLIVTVVVLVLAGAILGTLAASEASVRLLSRSRTRRLIESERPGAEALDALMERPSRLAAAAAVWRAVAYAVVAVLAAWAARELLPVGDSIGLSIVAGALGAIILFTLGEALPRTLAVHNPEKVGLAAARLAHGLTSALAPVARFFAVAWVKMVSLVAEEPVSDPWLTGDEYRPDAPESEESDREEAEEAFLDAVVEFASKIVREVMVPRTDMVCLEDIASVADAVAVIGTTGLSRVPVFHETLDDIRGVLYAKDLLQCQSAQACPDRIGPLARPAYFVPETKPVDELLVEMRQRKTHIALVADEYGGTAGLVTIEDLLEEIVGEIFDEYDRAEPMVTQLEDGTLLLDARLPIDDLNDLLGTAIELEADSIGGLFVEIAGHIPEPGESIEIEGVKITARSVEGTRVRALVVCPTSDPTKEDDSAEAHNGG